MTNAENGAVLATARETLEGHVAEAILAERAFLIEVVGQALGESELQMREEIEQTIEAKLKQAIGPPGPAGCRGEAGPIGPQGESGIEKGPAGKLPLVRAYKPEAVHYEGDVVVHLGATWQALRDTGRAPPHGDDWVCLAAAGIDASTPTIRETYDAEARYQHLDIVAQGGSSFIARKDEPGACPGPGWQLIASAGRPGRTGPIGRTGERGEKGDKGDPGPVILDWEIDRASYQAVPIMSDGTLGPPLALRALFEQFHQESRG
jgi:hypothetical protein